MIKFFATLSLGLIIGSFVTFTYMPRIQSMKGEANAKVEKIHTQVKQLVN